jgi:transposase
MARVILPTKPYTPRHKGKVEAGVKYVQNNALARRTFDSLAAQNEHLAHWEATTRARHRRDARLARAARTGQEASGRIARPRL